MSNCTVCNKELTKSIHTYCSNKCQRTDHYNKYISKWKLGLVTGSRGIYTKNISGHIKRYLIELFGEKCSNCGWNKRNPITHNVPLEIDHINGLTEDNRAENLRLICPNCHALTVTYKNLNKGKGRLWRKLKYKKNVS